MYSYEGEWKSAPCSLMEIVGLFSICHQFQCYVFGSWKKVGKCERGSIQSIYVKYFLNLPTITGKTLSPRITFVPLLFGVCVQKTKLQTYYNYYFVLSTYKRWQSLVCSSNCQIYTNFLMLHCLIKWDATNVWDGFWTRDQEDVAKMAVVPFLSFFCQHMYFHFYIFFLSRWWQFLSFIPNIGALGKTLCYPTLSINLLL